MGLREVLPEQIGGNRRGVRRVGGYLVFAARFGFEPQRLHDGAYTPTLSTSAARVAMLLHQLAIDARRAVFAFERGEHALG